MGAANDFFGTQRQGIPCLQGRTDAASWQLEGSAISAAAGMQAFARIALFSVALCFSEVWRASAMNSLRKAKTQDA